jgi:hypothetical protein
MMRRRPIARRAVRTAAVAGTAAVVGGRMGARRAQAQAAPAPEQQYAPAPAPPPPPAAPAPDRIEQLTKLAALKESGALTEAEFEAEKAKLLA